MDAERGHHGGRAVPKITTFLSYNDRAEEAARFYVSIFRNSRIRGVTRYGDGAPRPKGSVMTVQFELDGQDFVALNGGPYFKFTEGISLSVACRDQKEIDTYWKKLSRGGEPGPCGWLKDKFGLSWQINPANIGRYFGGGDADRSKRVMAALLKMKKLSIAGLEKAYDGE
jgi:predicted 3-demethylubiquinone-9 3-methyltransferase (glyoxalase superfamily)